MTRMNHRIAAANATRRRLLQGAAGFGAATFIGAGMPGLAGRASARQDTVLRYWLPGGSPLFCETHSAVADAFAATQEGVSFEQVQCGTAESNDFIQVLLGAIAARNPPDVTILWDTPVSLGVRGALEPLNARMVGSQYSMAENWPEGLLSSTQFGGETWGLPVTAGVFTFWYNPELLDEQGIPSGQDDLPKTWDEWRKLSAEFVEWDGDTLVKAGFLPFGFDYDPATMPIWSALNGGQIFDPEAVAYTIDSDANVEMMDFMVSWLDEQYKGNIGAVQSSAGWNGYANADGLPPAFQEGLQLAMENGTWLMGDYMGEGDPLFSNWELAGYPVGPSGSETYAGTWPNWMSLPKSSANPDLGFAFMDYMAGEGVKQWFAAVPDVPTNKTIEVANPAVLVETRGEEFATRTMDFISSQANISAPMWNSPVQNFAMDQLRRALEQMMTKSATPKDALAEAQAACQAELEKTLGQ
jgi:multiple sugar transport system substrate-binding protein